MKKLLSILLCILLLTGCAATYDGPTVAKPMLTEYTCQHYTYIFGNADLLYSDRSIFAYDIYGNIARIQEYRDGELDSVTNYRYDDRGNQISSTTWDHSGWIPLPDSRRSTTYDDQDRVLTISYRNGWGRETDRTVYTYDDEAGTRTYQDETGEIVQTTWYDENGLDIRQTAGEYETVYEYDANGNRTGWISYKNGVQSDRYQARYDEQNRQVWGAHYDEHDNLTSEHEYRYDDDTGTMTHRRADGQVRIEYYHPDGRRHMIEDYNSDGALTMLQRYYYQEIQIPAKEE